MPKAGYASVTVRETVYELARKKAEAERINVSELTERAIQNYVAGLQELEDRARVVVEIMQQLEQGRRSSEKSARSGSNGTNTFWPAHDPTG